MQSHSSLPALLTCTPPSLHLPPCCTAVCQELAGLRQESTKLKLHAALLPALFTSTPPLFLHAQELAEFRQESTELKNQGVTIRRLEERARELEAALAEKASGGGRAGGSGRVGASRRSRHLPLCPLQAVHGPLHSSS